MGNDHQIRTASLRDHESARWLASLELFRACEMELREVRWIASGLTPYGFFLTVSMPGTFDPSWIPLIERKASSISTPQRLHQMIATNAAAWLQTKGRVALAQELRALGAQEVALLEWKDGAVDLWEGPGPLPEKCSWKILDASVEAISKHEQRVTFWGAAATKAYDLQQLVKRLKKVSIPEWCQPWAREGTDELPESLGWSGAVVERLQGIDSQGSATYFLGAMERAEGVEAMASLAAAEGIEGPMQVRAGWLTPDQEELGDLIWWPNGEVSTPLIDQWLQSTQKRLKLLGFECEVVVLDQVPASSRAGHQAWKQARTWLQKWLGRHGVAASAAICWDQQHSIDEIGGPVVVWRAFDPMGASWPVAMMALPVDGQARWRGEQKRVVNRKRDGLEVEQRVRRIGDTRWVVAVSALNLVREEQIEEAWREGNVPGPRKCNRQ
ncbi:MAG: hypothetical protein ACOYKZ_07010 [Chlamydiia bacterium]